MLSKNITIIGNIINDIICIGASVKLLSLVSADSADESFTWLIKCRGSLRHAIYFKSYTRVKRLRNAAQHLGITKKQACRKVIPFAIRLWPRCSSNQQQQKNL